MDHNQVYEADSGLGVDVQATGRLSNGTQSNLGSRAAVSSVGRYGGDLVPSTTEATPLLSNSGTEEDDAPVDTWEGASDFIGLPWWKQPSVSRTRPYLCAFD